MLLALREIHDAEAQLGRREPKLENTLANAMLRCARRALADGKVTKGWLKEHGFDAVLGKLRETRAEKLIAEEVARRSQPSLPDREPALEDTPLIANLPLPEAVEAQYVQDLAEFRNVRIREQRSIVRDQQLARHAKEKAAYRCQICRDRIEDPVGARRFVQAHHIEPLSEFGSDTPENVVVLCPSCHARLHAHDIKIERTDEGIRVVTSRAETVLSDGAEGATLDGTDAVVCERIVHLFNSLARACQARLLVSLTEKTTRLS